MSEKKVHLTSGEIASLWTDYMNSTMVKCMTGFMLRHLEDPDIKPVIQHTYDMSVSNLEQLHTIFEKDGFKAPNGFSEQDVNMEASWLFTDTFCLSYVNHIARIGMVTYGGFLSMCARSDIRDYFIQPLRKSTDLYNQSTDISLQKGINARSPYMEVPQEMNYVDSKKYMSGLNPFSEKRPLNAIEISHLYMNIMTNNIGVKLCLAFAQTSPKKEVQEYMLRAKEISKKHIKVFSDLLLQNDMEVPQIPDIAVSDSTTKTFSDKLMMFHMSLISSGGIGNYAAAGANSQRSDLTVNYERLSLEVARLAKSGTDIMIKHQWLEQPPETSNRNKLARDKEEEAGT